MKTRGVGLCLAAVWVLTALLTAQAAPTVPLKAPSDLVVSGSIAKAKVRISESIPFWVMVKNPGSSSIKSILLVQYPDSEYSLCVKSVATGNCVAATPGSELLPELSPNQSYTMWGELKPKSEHAAEKLVFILGWATSSTAKSFTAVPLGDNKVQSDWDYWWDTWISGVVKTLAVPAALSLLALMLDWLTKGREKRQRDKEQQEAKAEADKAKQLEEQKQGQEKERLKAEADRLREQAVATETWKQMLPVSHKYAATFYLPLSSTAEDAIDAFDESNHEGAFFHILLLLKRIDLAKETIGGLFFKSYAGEALAQQCWGEFRNKFLGKETESFRVKMEGISQLIDPKAKFGDFQAKYLQNPAKPEADGVAETFVIFKERMAEESKKPCWAYLKGFYAILDFESNRPYEHWYQQKAKLKTTEKAAAVLIELGSEIEGAEKYFEEALTIIPEKKNTPKENQPAQPSN